MIDDIEIQKSFFHPVCNKEEIERIFNVKDAKDYLLKLRAETIVDHMRLFRVYRNKALADEKNWSLERSFDSSHFDTFLDQLPEKARVTCSKVTFGNMFSNDPNGSIFKSDYGPIITISEALRFFLKFSHLALLDFGTKVPPHVRMNALRIAIRVMLKTEALDFLMDPRGIVPQNVGEAIHAPIGLQLKFIAGHEFAHYVLGHITETNVIDKPIFFAISDHDQDYKPIKVYTQFQKEEFEADIQAILLPQHNPEQRAEAFHAALLWFGCVDLYEAVSNAVFPKSSWNYQSHPTTRDRIENILTKVPTPPASDLSDWKQLLATLDSLKKLLLEDVSVNFETYEMYGSVYLDKPNTEWRGPKLIDRVDYY